MIYSKIKPYLQFYMYTKNGAFIRPTLPIIVFLSTFALTLVLTKISHDSERKANIQQANFDSKEITKNIELLLLNDTLRLQIYLENFDMSRQSTAKASANLMAQLLNTTVFQRAAVFDERKLTTDSAPELLRVVTFKRSDDTINSGEKESRFLQSPYLKQKIFGMKSRNLRTNYSISHYNGYNTLSLIWRSQFRSGEYAVLTTLIQPLFNTGNVKKNLYAVLSDPEVNLSLMTYWDSDGKIQVTAQDNEIKKSRADLLFLNQSPLISSSSSIKIDWYMPQSQIFSAATLTTFFSGFIISILFSVLLHFILVQNRRISQLVVSRTVDLERAVSDAQEANLAKTRFLANMSHELRTPLNIILGMTELIENKVNDAKTLEFISTMRSAGDHLLTLITDILSMSKEESVDINIKNSPITTIVFIEEIGRLIGPECRKSGLAFDLQPAHDLPSVILGDPARVRQVLTNLLKNAIKYTRKGFVTLKISKINKASAQPGLVSLRFEVVDSGIGIPSEKQNEIFKRFFQLEGAKMLADGGVGLGLSIVKDLVTKMGGEINVRSELQKGSTFIVDLDFEARDPKPWIEDFNYTSMTGKKLLVVENELDESFKPRMIQMLSLSTVTTEVCDLKTLNEKIARDSIGEYYRIILSANSNLNFSFLDLKDLQSTQKFIFIGNEERSSDNSRLLQYGKIIDNSPVLPTRLYAALELIQPRRRLKSKTQPDPELNEEIKIIKKDLNLSILVADDDVTNQDLLRAYFDGKPWTTVFTNNGLEALEAYRKDQPDVVIADFRMPVLDGFEMAKSIRDYEELNKLKRTPIVIVTADALEETEKRSKEIPNTVFLTKPVRRSRLIEAINTVSK
jgi:signal transduction histidine kinase/CheY-like chemotaxis protein